jgi:hypothetical protein
MKPVPLLVALLMLSFCTLHSCSKSSGGGTPPPPPAEADLVVTTDPANSSLQPPALGPYYLKVSISSTLPTNGVKIEITAKKDDGSNTIFFTSSVNKTTPINDFTITGTPVATLCLVEIKVTSLTKASNTWSGSYRYSSK